MGIPVVMGDKVTCSFGAAPVPLVVIPKGPPVMFEGKFVATVMDFAPMANIAPFGTCMSLANPQVAAATAAALGALTPMPCIPVTTGPWKPGALKTKVNNFNVLDAASTAMCAWAGVITVMPPPGAMKEMVT
jgi:hypothetical protein